MKEKILELLRRHTVLTLATLRPDGWPHATMVGYVNEGLTLYFLVSRRGQKWANLQRDPRAAVAIGGAFRRPSEIRGLSISAEVDEVRDEPAFQEMVGRLSRLGDGYFDPASIHRKTSALMRAHPAVVTVIDYSLGLGHSDVVLVGPGGTCLMQPAQAPDWGPDPRALG